MKLLLPPADLTQEDWVEHAPHLPVLRHARNCRSLKPPACLLFATMQVQVQRQAHATHGWSRHSQGPG
jgi:hypothetical protein